MNSQNDNQVNKGYQSKETFDKSPYVPQMEIILRGVGFLVKKFNILANITKINQLAIDEKIQINSISPIVPHKISEQFTESYY